VESRNIKELPMVNEAKRKLKAKERQTHRATIGSSLIFLDSTNRAPGFSFSFPFPGRCYSLLIIKLKAKERQTHRAK
jgi:hypothetical protein